MTAERPWARDAGQIAQALGVEPGQGLGVDEAARRLRRFGPNQLQSIRPRHAWGILVDQFRSIVVLLLCVAAVAAIGYGDHAEGLAVIAVIAINTAIGFFTELRATRSMEALRQLGHFQTVVRRGGEIRKVDAGELVPGDVVVVEGGDVITADLRLVSAAALQADESTLTGESTPVGKHTEPLPPDTPLMERANLLFKGTSVTRGSGSGIVVGTGPATELGRIAQLVREAESQETPLQKRLDALGRRLVWVMLLVALMIAVAGVAAGRDVVLAIEVAVALMVAAIPEGLPIVATIALARGMWRMARRKALIVRLSAVETLGATGIILTDKTGTLTENRMTAHSLLLSGHRVEITGAGLETGGDFLESGQPLDQAVGDLARDLLETAVLCNNASLSGDDEGGLPAAIGDPTEVALLVAGAKMGIHPAALLADQPRLREWPFDAETKCMATFNQADGAVRVSFKGAPESLLPLCTAVRTASADVPLDGTGAEAFLRDVHALGEQGLRTLALATKTVSDETDAPYADLVLLGAVGLLDPARAGVREAVEQCRDAGIRVVMVTGDHIATARHIAEDVHLLDRDAPSQACVDMLDQANRGQAQPLALAGAQVIARVSPQQKFDLISHFQDQGHIVAMTGDGVSGGHGAAGRSLQHHRRGHCPGPGDLRQHPQVRGVPAVLQHFRGADRGARHPGGGAIAAAAAANPVSEPGHRRVPGAGAGRGRGPRGPDGPAAAPRQRGHPRPAPLGRNRHLWRDHVAERAGRHGHRPHGPGAVGRTGGVGVILHAGAEPAVARLQHARHRQPLAGQRDHAQSVDLGRPGPVPDAGAGGRLPAGRQHRPGTA
jgi:Ca2+-transporting ATPase